MVFASIFRTVFCASVLVFCSTSVKAEEPFSLEGATSFATEYSFRGISQTDRNPAVQGEIGLIHESGLYASLWGSNVDLEGVSLELDALVGYRFPLANGEVNLGGIYYAYPGGGEAHDYNFAEGFIGYTLPPISDLTFGGQLNISPDYFGNSGVGVYAQATATYALPIVEGVTLNIASGRQWVEDNAAFDAIPDYNDWSAGITYAPLEKMEFGLAYVDTDLSGNECAAELCDGRVTGTLTFSFP